MMAWMCFVLSYKVQWSLVVLSTNDWVKYGHTNPTVGLSDPKTIFLTQPIVYIWYFLVTLSIIRLHL